MHNLYPDVARAPARGGSTNTGTIRRIYSVLVGQDGHPEPNMRDRHRLKPALGTQVSALVTTLAVHSDMRPNQYPSVE